MGSCVSKKAARAGGKGKASAPLPAAEKEAAHRALPPVAEVDAEEEEVKEVVLSETPALPPRPPRSHPPDPEPVIKPTKEQPEAESSEASSSEACGASDTASVASASKEKAKVKLLMEPGAEKRAVADAPSKKGRAAPAPDQERERSKLRSVGGGGTGRARSPSPSSAHRRQHQHHQQQHLPAARPRREQQHPPVVSGIGCRSGRFSPSAARRAAESAVRRTHSAREADMALPSSKRSLIGAAINGYGYGGGAALISRRDGGERSGRRADSPTGSRRAPASPSASTHRPASPMRKAAKEHGTPERARLPRVRDGDEHKKVEEGEEGALAGQNNPSVAMECFIFL